MSFSFEGNFVNPEVAKLWLEQQHAPDCVKDFIRRALTGLVGAVYVKANGHLFNNDYRESNCSILVREFPLISELGLLA